MSPKYPIYADQVGQLQQRGIGRRNALMMISNQTAVPLVGEWIEAFWCEQCQETRWYHVCKKNDGYDVSPAKQELWQQATGVIDPLGNPTVGEFTRRQSQQVGYQGLKDFNFIN